IGVTCLARKLIAVTDSNSDYLAEVNRRRKANEDAIRIIPLDRPYVAPEFFNGTVQLPSSSADNEARIVRSLVQHTGKSETGLRLSELRKLRPFSGLSDALNTRLMNSTALNSTAVDQRKLPASFANVASAHGHGNASRSALGPTIRPMGRPPI